MPIHILRGHKPSSQTDPASSPSQATSGVPGFWRTGLLLATSAALGGIAVAIWNRRTLAQMRQPPTDD